MKHILHSLALAVLLPIFLPAQAPAPAGELSAGHRVALRLNPLTFAHLQPNLGIRLNTAADWKPELSLAYQFPFINHVVPMAPHTLLMSGFKGMMGHGVTVYGGLTRLRGEWTGRGSAFSILLGMRAFRTGVYYWEDGGSTGQRCGMRDELRATFGPKAIWSERLVLSPKHLGLELYMGMGFRLGFQRRQVLREGEIYYDCAAYPDFVPDTELGPARFAWSPTLHMGLALLAW